MRSPRRQDIPRIEASRDAVFAFAPTPPVVSLHAPTPPRELIRLMTGFVPSGARRRLDQRATGAGEPAISV